MSKEDKVFFTGLFTDLKTAFSGLENRFDGIERRFDGLEGRFGGLETKFDELDRQVRYNGLLIEEIHEIFKAQSEANVYERLTRVEERLDGVDKKLEELPLIKKAVMRNSKLLQALE